MNNILIILAVLSFFQLSCKHTPERYSVYQNILYKDCRAQVLYVGKNWEIKDAVNAKELKDDECFHTEKFWSYPANKTLVVFSSVEKEYYQYADAYTLEQFSKEFKLISPD